MRKLKNSGATDVTRQGNAPESLPDLDARAGRVGGAQVAFGSPGPRINMDRILESWRDGATVGGSARDQPEAATRPGRPRTVSLPDGTTISFTVAGATLAVES